MIPLLAGVAGTELSPEEERLFRRIQPAGYILFSRNIETSEQTRRLTDSLHSLSELEPLLTIDQEGGRVVRTKALGLEMPSALQLSNRGREADIVLHARLTAEALRLLGFNMNLAPVLDMGRPEAVANALPDRCWGNDPQEVLSRACVYAGTLKRNGVLTCGKHFPGLGRAAVDAHFELPVVEAEREDILNRDVVPFMALGESLLDAVMCAHVFFPAMDAVYPSSLSREILTGFLRNQLGYEGLVMTDDLDMGAITGRYPLPEAAALAVEAGNDLAMICHSHDRLDEVSVALKKVSSSRLYDVEDRLERFSLKKIPCRMDYSASRWKEVLEESRVFMDLFSSSSGESAGFSPVARY